MPQLDTTYFVSQIFWLCILFALFYLSVRYLIMPRIEAIVKARILVTEDSNKLKEKFASEIEEIKESHKANADEVRNKVKQMQMKANQKFEDFSKKAKADLQKKLDQKMADSESKINKLTEDFYNSKDSEELAIRSAAKILEEMASIKVDKSKLKKYSEA